MYFRKENNHKKKKTQKHKRRTRERLTLFLNHNKLIKFPLKIKSKSSCKNLNPNNSQKKFFKAKKNSYKLKEMLIRINTITNFNFKRSKKQNRFKNDFFSKVYTEENKKKIGYYSTRDISLKKLKQKQMEKLLEEKFKKKKEYIKRMRRFSRNVNFKFINKDKSLKKKSIVLKNFKNSFKKDKKKKNCEFINRKFSDFYSGFLSQISANNFDSKKNKKKNIYIHKNKIDKKYLFNVYKIKKHGFSKELKDELFSYK